MQDEVLRSFCNQCLGDTDHLVVWKNISTVQHAEVVSEIRTLAVCCCGCKECAIREEKWYFDYTPEPGSQGNLSEVKFRPARLWRRPPNWVTSIEDIDRDLQGLLDEVYSAVNDEQTRLLSMGVRSVLDHVMTVILGSDLGGFERKLEEMVKQGHITDRQRQNISIVIDAGSASTHRGYRPPRELIEEMVVVMENIVRDHYITGPMLLTAKSVIPPRPPRQAKAGKSGK